MSPLPANVVVSSHPCLKAKLSQLRSATCSSKQTRDLVREITLLLACDALRNVLNVEETGTVSVHSECSIITASSDPNLNNWLFWEREVMFEWRKVV